MAPTVLVTGCSSGIGRATAEAFLEEEWSVYATSREAERVKPFDRDRATVLELDVRSERDAERAVEQAVDETGRLDCVVNNAGYGQFGPLEDVPPEAVREQLDVNVVGPHRVARAALPYMREQGEGRIVNVGSIEDRLPLAGTGVYSGSKFALAGMTATLRQEVAGHGVDAVLVEPGLIATAFYDRALASLSDLDRSPAYGDVYDVLDKTDLFRNPVPGVGKPEAVADVILEAATATDPAPRYQAGPLGTPGALAGDWLPPAVRDRLVRGVVALGATDTAQRLLRWAKERTGSGGSRSDDRPRADPDRTARPDGDGHDGTKS